MSIVTWKDIYDYIKAKESLTTKELYGQFKDNYSNVRRKINSLVSHRLINENNGVISIA